MSYDVSLRDLDALDANYTWNVYPMFAAVVSDGPNDWSGLPASQVLAKTSAILAAFRDEPARFRAMNPGNGWGSFEGAREFIRKIEDACADHPDAVFECC